MRGARSSLRVIGSRCLVVGVVSLFCLAPTIASGYGGFLTLASGGLTGGGNWTGGGIPMVIEWEVVHDAGNNWWNYTYWFSHARGDTRHLILQASPDLADGDVFNVRGMFGDFQIGDFGPDADNPGMPETMHGIRFYDAWNLTTRIQFSSRRAPGWGDFYATGHDFAGLGTNMAWNTGFTGDDSDPLAPPVDRHLLVPDGVMTVVPEPTTLLLLAGGLLALAGVQRRRHRS